MVPNIRSPTTDNSLSDSSLLSSLRIVLKPEGSLGLLRWSNDYWAEKADLVRAGDRDAGDVSMEMGDDEVESVIADCGTVLGELDLLDDREHDFDSSFSEPLRSLSRGESQRPLADNLVEARLSDLAEEFAKDPARRAQIHSLTLMSYSEMTEEGIRCTPVDPGVLATLLALLSSLEELHLVDVIPDGPVPAPLLQRITLKRLHFEYESFGPWNHHMINAADTVVSLLTMFKSVGELHLLNLLSLPRNEPWTFPPGLTISAVYVSYTAPATSILQALVARPEASSLEAIDYQGDDGMDEGGVDRTALAVVQASQRPDIYPHLYHIGLDPAAFHHSELALVHGIYTLPISPHVRTLALHINVHEADTIVHADRGLIRPLAEDDRARELRSVAFVFHPVGGEYATDTDEDLSIQLNAIASQLHDLELAVLPFLSRAWFEGVYVDVAQNSAIATTTWSLETLFTPIFPDLAAAGKLLYGKQPLHITSTC